MIEYDKSLKQVNFIIIILNRLITFFSLCLLVVGLNTGLLDEQQQY
jgi:hypothetical protein